MADKKKESKNVLERAYNVPLRREWLKVPKYKRAKKTIKALKEFMIRHMKSEDIKIGKYLNTEIWKHGMRNPPHHVKVNAVKNDEGVVRVELVGAPEEKKVVKKDKPEAKKEVKGEAEPKKEKTDVPKDETPAKEEAEEPKKTDSEE